MPHRIYAVALALLSLASTAVAQRPQRVNELLAAATLPVSAAQARKEGASNDEVRGALDAMRAAKLPAHEARAVIDEERSARRANGPVDNFGAFVQTKLKAGLRGRELAAAIKAEHVARGKGKPGATPATGTKARNSAATKTAAKPAPAKKKPAVDSTVRSQKNANHPAPAAKKPVTKARPTGRTTKPTA